MPDYKYIAKDSSGRKVSGTMNADSPVDVKQELRKKDLTIISLDEKSGQDKRKKIPRPHVKSKDISVFTRQLSTMVAAGIPMLESLEVLAEQADDPGFRYCLEQIVADVRSGTDFSAALSHHPVVFKRIYVNMVKAGEASGQVEDILNRLAQYQEANDALKAEIKSAMTYPVVSIVMIVGIALFLLIFIVPEFKNIFSALGAELPAPTRILLSISDFMRTKVYIWLPIALGAIIGAIMYSRTTAGAYAKDWLTLRLPVLGMLFRKVAISRFARTFSTLLQSGVPILATLEIVATTSGNKVIEDAVTQASQNIRDGEPLATPLAKSGVFPPMVTRMISIGERSGALETLSEKISDFYDQEVRTTVEQLTSLIEPIMIGVMGFFVGGIVMAVFLPIFSLTSNLGKNK
ncbi:MAG: type II secretion system F family protein [Planctomycetota bacterium]